MTSPSPTTDQGHVEMPATPARGAERVGLIWVLGISTLAAAAVLLALFMIFGPRLHGVAQKSVVRTRPAASGSFRAPPDRLTLIDLFRTNVRDLVTQQGPHPAQVNGE